MLVDLVAGLVHGFERRAAQLKLAAGFEGDRTSAVIFEGDDVVFFDDGLPAEPSHAFEQGPYAVRPVIRRALQVAAAEDEFLVLGANSPRLRRLAAGGVILDQLPLVGDR